MFKKKKFLRIIAVSFAIVTLEQVGIASAAWGMNSMEKEFIEMLPYEENKMDPMPKEAWTHAMHSICAHIMIDGPEQDRTLGDIFYEGVMPTQAVQEKEQYKQINLSHERMPQLRKLFSEYKNEKHTYFKSSQVEPEMVNLRLQPMMMQEERIKYIENCEACKLAEEDVYADLTYFLIKKHISTNIEEKTHTLNLQILNLTTQLRNFENEKNNVEQRFLLLEKENSEFKQCFSYIQQKFEESQKKHEECQKDIREFKQQAISLSEENKSLKKLFTTLPSTKECDLFNTSEEKFLNDMSMLEKSRMLYQGAHSLNNIINTLKQKANELGLDDKNIISLFTQIISEDQVPEYCMPLLLRKDPQIFLPWTSTKTVFELMFNEVSLEKNSLPTHILVEDEESKEDGILLSSYIKRELEQGLDAKISIEGKNKFKNMVAHIEKIQGNFWKDNEEISTVPVLLKKLNGGDNDQEWVPGWSTLEEDYKKYVSATVLYKMSKRSLPKKYEDIESYLMDK